MTPRRKRELDAFNWLMRLRRLFTSRRRSLGEFGRLLHEGWQIKRSLTQKITNAEIDEIYDAGRSAAALSGKLLGAGGGGFMLFFHTARTASGFERAPKEATVCSLQLLKEGQPGCGVRAG